MPITHKDVFTWVEDNQHIVNSEVHHRIIASRAYYAAFYAVDGLYSADNKTFASSGTHAKLVNTLKASASKEDRQIGFVLQACKDIRTEADYELEGSFTENDVEEAMSFTRRILELVSRESEALKTESGN